MPPRESVDSKGRRYLGEGRLTVQHVDAALVRATCRGGGAIYVLGWSGEGWWCGCPARGRCAHLAALELVVVRGGAAEMDDPEPVVTRPTVEDDDQDEAEPLVSL